MKLGRFLADYLLVPLGMPAAVAVLSAFHAAGEVGPGAYATLSAAWPHLHEPARHDIARTMASDHGKISNWAYQKLFDEAIDDAGALELPGASGSLQAERDRLNGLIGVSQPKV